MDINARINWIPGMEINTDTVKGLYGDINIKQRIAVRAMLGGERLGLLPEVTFNNKGSFVKNIFEMPRFQCMAILPTGQIIDVDEPVKITIPVLYGAEYYLTVGIGKESIPFERNGVPYKRPSYEYAIKTLDEITDDVFPFIRFKNNEGVLSYDQSYIPPTLLLTEGFGYEDYISRYLDGMNALLEHPNMDADYGRHILLYYRFLLKGLTKKSQTSNLLQLTQGIVQAMNYYIVSRVEPDTPVDIPRCTPYDVESWLSWTDDYLHTNTKLLDKVVREDNSIDVEALKEEIKNELYEKLYKDLYEALKPKIKEELTAEMTEQLRGVLTAYMNEKLKPAIIEELRTELSEELYDKLYRALYDALFAALNIPRAVEEEDTFTPLI